MTVKDFLRNIKIQNARIRVVEREIIALRGLAEYKSPHLDPIGGGHGTPDHHSRETLMAKLADMTTELHELKMMYLSDIEEATKMILSIKDDRTLEIFSKRYLEFEKWEKIAEDLDIGFQWVHKLHNRGLIELSKRYPSFER